MRPDVWLNCATSQDGFLAGPERKQVRLSCDEDMQRVHAMRAAADAILVGVETVLTDDPSLRVKGPGDHPIRVVLDSHGRTPTDARVVGEDTLIYSTKRDDSGHPGNLPHAGHIEVPTGEGGVDLNAVLADLHARGIRSLMVEGGAKVLASFIANGCWDEATVYVAPRALGGGPALPEIPGFVREDPLGEGVLRRYVNDGA